MNKIVRNAIDMLTPASYRDDCDCHMCSSVRIVRQSLSPPESDTAQVVGRIYEGKAELNSIGRALPQDAPLYSTLPVNVIRHEDITIAGLDPQREEVK